MTERSVPPSVSGDRVALAILAIFAALTALLAARLNIWTDEAYTLHSTARGFADGLRAGMTFEAQAPLYFGVLALWRTANDSIFFARAFSIGCALVTLVVAWRFAARYLRPLPPAAVVAATALNPFLIWAALEMRPYAAALALSSLLLATFFRGWVDDRTSLGARVWFAILAIVGGYTQYYVVAFLPAAAVALLGLGRPRRLRGFLLASALVGVALAPLAFVVPAQLRTYAPLGAVAPLPGYAIVLALFDFLFPHDWIGTWVRAPLANAAYFALAVVPPALAFGALGRIDGRTRVLLALPAVLCALFGLVIGVAHVHVLFPRHTAVLFAPTLLAAFALLARVTGPRRRATFVAFGAIYVAFAVASLWATYRGLSKPGDWANVARFLTAHAAPGDTVATFDAEAALPLGRYFAKLPIRPIPRPISLERFDETAFVLHDGRDVAAVLRGPAARDGRLWLVTDDVCRTKAAFYGCAYLTAYAAAHFTLLGETRFHGSTVAELRPVRAR